MFKPNYTIIKSIVFLEVPYCLKHKDPFDSFIYNKTDAAKKLPFHKINKLKKQKVVVWAFLLQQLSFINGLGQI